MILTIDQALNKSGWVLFSFEKELVDYGIVDLNKMPKDNQANKRRVLIEKIDEIVKKYDVKQITLTGIYQKSPKVFSILAKIQGSIEDYCCNNNIQCFSFFGDSEWLSKIGIKNSNRDANKLHTKEYVLSILPNLPDNLEEDIYDAIGVSSAYFKMFE